MTSLTVITFEIGQSAGKISKFVMIEYDIPSTTERLSANYDESSILSLLKIQSTPFKILRK